MTALDAALERLRARADQGLGLAPVEPPEDPLPPFIERLRGARVLEIAPRAWDRLDGAFDVIHCGELEREPDPHALLVRMRALLAPGGSVLVGSLALADPERSELARFARGHDGLWWLPGRLCLRRMVETAGLAIVEEGPTLEGPADLVRAYLRAQAA